MALDTRKENLGDNGSEAAASPIALDGDLVNRYLELQVSWLNLQLEAARREAAETRDEAALAVTTVRLWRQAAPTALIALLLACSIAVLSAVTWNDLWRGLSRGQPGNLTFVINWAAGASSQVRAVVGFMREWKDVLLWILGGGVLLAFKRLAYRSVRSALVIVLALVLSFSLLAGLAIADIHLVGTELTPMHVTWRGWAAVMLAVIAGVILFLELSDVALTSPASFEPRSQLGEGLRRWIARTSTGTGIGRLLCWLATPHGWLRWLVTLVAVTGISIILCIAAGIGWVVAGSDLWFAAYVAAIPLGPLWWLLLLAVVASSPTLRQPAGGRLRFAVFAAAPALSLAFFVAILLSPGAYDAQQNLNAGLAVVTLLAIETWIFWFLWAGIAISPPLRIVFLPLVVGCAATVPLYYGLLPFLGLVAILTVSVPWSLWRSRPAPIPASAAS
jgi:hypothetical protein